MADIFQFSEQEILSRCFMAGENLLAVGEMVGDGASGLQAQEVLARSFDSTVNMVR